MSYTLSGAQRNYKKPGAKLRPRDAYTAGCIAPNGYRNSAECRRAFAAEFKAMGGFERMDLSRSERRVVRLKKGMSTRAIKRVERCLYGDKTQLSAVSKRRNFARLYNYMMDVRVTNEIMAIDARMLANAR